MHEFLDGTGSTYIGSGRILGYAMRTFHEVPFIYPTVFGGAIFGEVYVVGENTTGTLDYLEGGYKRTPVQVMMDEGGAEPLEAEVYVWDREIPTNSLPIHSGKYENPLSG